MPHLPLREVERLRRWRASNPDKNRDKNARWKLKNREKYLAHKAVEQAVLTGALRKQPCERCGCTKLVHAHHDDYSQRLSVRWLCPVHHRARHAELRSS